MGRVAKAFVAWGVELPEEVGWAEMDALYKEGSRLHFWEDEDNHDHVAHLTGGSDSYEAHCLCWRSTILKGDEYDRVTPLGNGFPEPPTQEEWLAQMGPFFEELWLDGYVTEGRTGGLGA